MVELAAAKYFMNSIHTAILFLFGRTIHKRVSMRIGHH